MNISRTHDLEQFITTKLKSGRYTSASEVIRDGLRLLVERDQLYQIRPSCKFSGDSLSLRSSLPGKPQLLPLLIEFDHF